MEKKNWRPKGSKAPRRTKEEMAQLKLAVVEWKISWLSDYEIWQSIWKTAKEVWIIRSHATKEFVYNAKRDEIVNNQVVEIENMLQPLLKAYKDDNEKIGIKLAIYDRYLETKKYIGKLMWVNIERIDTRNVTVDATQKFLDMLNIPKRTPNNLVPYVNNDSDKIIDDIKNPWEILDNLDYKDNDNGK